MRLLPRRGSRRIDSPRESELARRLSETAPAAETAGRPLSIHASPFGMSVADYLRAAAGAPAWSRRLVRLQNLEAELREQIEAAWQEHRRRFAAEPQVLAAAWRAHLAAIDLAPINELIDKHNAYYPIEAGLRMQWPSGRYLLPSGARYPLDRITPESLLAEYPPAGPDERGCG
jgi:hypothetical protein